MHRDRHYGVGLVLVSAAALAWSSAGYFTRLIPADAWTTSVWRSIFGGLLIALFAAVWLRGGLLAVHPLARLAGLAYRGQRRGRHDRLHHLAEASVADVSIIHATLRFVTAGLGWLWAREPVAPTTIRAGAVAAAGVVIMVSGTSLSGHLDGDALALLQTLSRAVAIVAVAATGMSPCWSPPPCRISSSR